jgi:hypothetical protein
MTKLFVVLFLVVVFGDTRINNLMIDHSDSIFGQTKAIAPNLSNQKKMFIDVGKISRNDLFDFLFDYPCSSELKENFRNYVNGYVNGDKINIVNMFIHSHDQYKKFELYANFASSKFGCNLVDNSMLDDTSTYGRDYGVQISPFTCTIENSQKCFNIEKTEIENQYDLILKRKHGHRSEYNSVWSFTNYFYGINFEEVN